MGQPRLFPLFLFFIHDQITLFYRIIIDLSPTPNHTRSTPPNQLLPFNQPNKQPPTIKMQFSAVVLALAAMAGAVSATE
jgi:hypothetical protein